MSRHLAIAAALAVAFSCVPDTPMPGDQVMGTYGFDATPLQLECEIPEVAASGFSFTGTFSRDSASADAWLRLNNVLRPARFDGQVVSGEYEARRVFGETVLPDEPRHICAGCSTVLRERFTLAILSKSQNDAVGDGCPPDALDGGVPQGGEVTLPGPVANGFDAVRACGELVDQVVATPLEGDACDPKCGQCRLRYQLTGARK